MSRQLQRSVGQGAVGLEDPQTKGGMVGMLGHGLLLVADLTMTWPCHPSSSSRGGWPWHPHQETKTRSKIFLGRIGGQYLRAHHPTFGLEGMGGGRDGCDHGPTHLLLPCPGERMVGMAMLKFLPESKGGMAQATSWMWPPFVR